MSIEGQLHAKVCEAKGQVFQPEQLGQTRGSLRLCPWAQPAAAAAAGEGQEASGSANTKTTGGGSVPVDY